MARDQLNRLAADFLDGRPALRELYDRHRQRPVRALDAYQQALGVLGEPFSLSSTGGRGYWPTVEGERFRARGRDLAEPDGSA
jgi:hypothetical protein